MSDDRIITPPPPPGSDAGDPADPRGEDRGPHRVRPQRLIALAIAAIMLAGIVGLVVVALIGETGDTTGAGLRPTIDVAAPAVVATEATAASPSDASVPTATAVGASGEATTTTSTLVTVAGVNVIDAPTRSDDLPMPDEPVVLPTFVTVPAPPSTLAAIALADIDPASVTGLVGWSVSTRDDDHLVLTNGARLIEVFMLGEAASADDALDSFYDRIDGDLQSLSSTPSQRLASPTTRFELVAGSQFTALHLTQQASTPITGSVIVGVGADGSAIAVTALRAGAPAADDLASDGAALRSLLAVLAP